MSDLGNKSIMAQNIQRLMEQAGKSRMQVCDDLGIKYTTFTDWVNAKTYPRIDKIEMMANYFGVSKSDLVESHSLSQEIERQKRLEQIADEIRERTRFIKIVVDSTYNFYSSLGALIGLPEPVPHEIALKPQESSRIERDIKSLVEKFLATATPEEKENFWMQYDKIGQEYREQIEHPTETSYPTSEEIEVYSELAGDFAAFYAAHPATEGPQGAPAPQEGKATPAADGPGTAPEGE